jgi:hypothetical protein
MPGKRRLGLIGVSAPGHHDLEHILDDVATDYFGGSLPTTIRWGRRAWSSRLLAQYDWELDEISVAPRLNSRRVPAYVIRYLIHHELCHRATKENRHDDAFRALEAHYRDLQRALAWIARYQPIE